MRNLYKICKQFLFVGLLIAICGTVARAQYEDGSLVGAIHDATGAAVGNAAVTVTNVGTGIAVKTTANGSGDYDLPSLRAGVYTVEATAPGFSSAVAKNITISVGGHQHIDLTLNVGKADATTVEVSDVALQLETESSERGQTVSEYQTESLPLVSRNYSDLLGLVTGSRQAPTAATTTSVTSLVRAGAYNVNGLRSMFNNYLLDGMDNNAWGESNQGFDNQIIQPPPDSINQFQVVTNNESAEYGRSAGATINVATRSGTNNFHSTLYEFLRNTDLNAFGYIHAITGTHTFVKPGFNRNQFGADFNGPIFKNKFFFFLDYEGFRQTLTPTVVFTVPTENEMGMNTASGAPVLTVNVQNPMNGKTYAAGTPITGINSASQKILGFFQALPSQCLTAAGSSAVSTSGATVGLATNNCATNAPFTDNADKGDLRLDYQQNEKSSWFLKISDRKETGINYTSEPLPLDGQGNGNGRIKILDSQVALGYNRIFSANKVLDVRLGLSGTKAGKYSLSIGNSAITFPGLPTDPTVAGGLPTTTFGAGFSTVGRQNTNPQWQNPSLLDPKVNFSWVKGKHSFKFGYEYEHIWMEVQDSNPLYGGFAYGGAYSLASGASKVDENYWADFLFGETSQYSQATYFKAHLLQTMHNVYAQDDFKVNSRLTLNLGLRWEYGSPYSERNNNLSNFDPTTQTMLTLNPGYTGANFLTSYKGSGTYGKTLVNPSLGDYAPRVGMAYSLTPSVVVRGGFGISYVHYTRAGSGDILPINAPNALFVVVTQPNPTSSNACPSGSPATNCYITMDQGFPSNLVVPTNFNPGTDNVTYIPKNTTDSYVQSYFVSVQKELAKNTLLDIAYVGNRGQKLQGFMNANQGNPALGMANASISNATGFARPFSKWGSTVGSTYAFGDITEAYNGFYSNFNALQVRYEQRFVKGLTLLNSFTWEHALDNASASLEGNTPSPQDANNLRADYGQSDYNLPVANITSLVYELPVGHGRPYLGSANSFVDSILGGWQVSAVNTAEGGTPYNVTYAPGSYKDLNGYTQSAAVSPQISATYRGANEYRPNIVPGQPLRLCNSGHSCINQRNAANGTINYINLAAFQLPATATSLPTASNPSGVLASPFGNAPRNAIRTPLFYQTDFDLNKRFSTPLEGLKIEFRAEAYNLFNHTNLYYPSSSVSELGSGGGTAAATNPSANSAAIAGTFEPRIIQFGLKVVY